MVTLFSCANVAFASFFDDGRWYMDSGWWELYIDDPENRTSLLDQNNRLEFITTSGGWTDEYDAERIYRSKWAFDLNYDFEFSVGFHYDHNPTGGSQTGGVGMDLFQLDALYSEYAYLVALSVHTRPYLIDGNTFYSELGTPEIESNNSWELSNIDGILWVRYDMLEDEISVEAMEKIAENLWMVVGYSDHTGLRGSEGVEQLKLGLRGWSHGASYNQGEAYLENFNLLEGTIITLEGQIKGTMTRP